MKETVGSKIDQLQQTVDQLRRTVGELEDQLEQDRRLRLANLLATEDYAVEIFASGKRPLYAAASVG